MPEFEGELSIDGKKYKIKGKFNPMGNPTENLPRDPLSHGNQSEGQVVLELTSGSAESPPQTEIMLEDKLAQDTARMLTELRKSVEDFPKPFLKPVTKP